MRPNISHTKALIINSLLMPTHTNPKHNTNKLNIKYLFTHKHIILHFFTTNKSKQKLFITQHPAHNINNSQAHIIYNLLLKLNSHMHIYNNSHSNKISKLTKFYLLSLAQYLSTK